MAGLQLFARLQGAFVSELRVTWPLFHQQEAEGTMTAHISEQLKNIEWPENIKWPAPRAWKVAFHAIDDALPPGCYTGCARYGVVAAAAAQSWLRDQAVEMPG
jgi:hypothetical protein